MVMTALSVAAIALAVTGIAVARNGAKQGGPQPCMNSLGSKGDVTWDKAVLWPPNHKLIPVTFTWTEPSSATSSTATHQLSVTGVTSVGSDQGSGQPTSKQDGGADYSPTTFPVNGREVADSTPATVTESLRAERGGTDKAGRVYTVNLKCH